MMLKVVKVPTTEYTELIQNVCLILLCGTYRKNFKDMTINCIKSRLEVKAPKPYKTQAG